MKFERKTFKLLIGGSTTSNACSMQGYKYGKQSVLKIWLSESIIKNIRTLLGQIMYKVSEGGQY